MKKKIKKYSNGFFSSFISWIEVININEKYFSPLRPDPLHNVIGLWLRSGIIKNRWCFEDGS